MQRILYNLSVFKSEAPLLDPIYIQPWIYNRASTSAGESALFDRAPLSKHSNENKYGNVLSANDKNKVASTAKMTTNQELTLSIDNASQACEFASRPKDQYQNNYTVNANCSEKCNVSKEKRFLCEFCGLCFGYPHVLNNHLLIHLDLKPHQCSVCSQSFRRDHHLKTHTITHTGERAYSCDYCEKRFAQKANLNFHLKMNNKQGSLVCNLCSIQFKYKCQLKEHKVIHQKEDDRSAEMQARKLRKRTADRIAVDQEVNIDTGNVIGRNPCPVLELQENPIDLSIHGRNSDAYNLVLVVPQTKLTVYNKPFYNVSIIK